MVFVVLWPEGDNVCVSRSFPNSDWFVAPAEMLEANIERTMSVNQFFKCLWALSEFIEQDKVFFKLAINFVSRFAGCLCGRIEGDFRMEEF